MPGKRIVTDLEITGSIVVVLGFRGLILALIHEVCFDCVCVDQSVFLFVIGHMNAPFR